MQCPNCGSFGVDSDLDYALCRTCGYNWTPSIEPDWNGDVYPCRTPTPGPDWDSPRFRPFALEDDDVDDEAPFEDVGDEVDNDWGEEDEDEEDADDWDDDDE